MRHRVGIDVDPPARLHVADNGAQALRGSRKVVQDADGHNEVESAQRERQVLRICLYGKHTRWNVSTRDIDRGPDVPYNRRHGIRGSAF